MTCNICFEEKQLLVQCPNQQCQWQVCFPDCSLNAQKSQFCDHCGEYNIMFGQQNDYEQQSISSLFFQEPPSISSDGSFFQPQDSEYTESQYSSYITDSQLEQLINQSLPELRRN